MPVELFPLGSQGLMAPRIGCGIMSAAFYSSGNTAADEAAQLQALDRLVELCAPSPAFIDTAWIYSHPTGLHSEEIVGKAIAKHGRDKFVVATKFGLLPGGAPPSSATDVIRSQYADSVRRLGCAPDLYYQHRPDLNRPIEAVIADLKAMIDEGKFNYIGLSECTPDELRRAHSVHPISAVQMEWSLAERGIETSGLLDACVQLGVGVVCYSPLARGFLTGALRDKSGMDASDLRASGVRYPRFADGAMEANVTKAERLAGIALRRGCTSAQLALAWLLAKGPFVFPIPGSKTASRVEENLGAVKIALTPEEVAEIEALDLAAVGDRYAPAMLGHTWERKQKA